MLGFDPGPARASAAAAAAAEACHREKSFHPLLTAIEHTFEKLREAATSGHPNASKVAGHRRLLRLAVCSLHGEVLALRQSWEGCTKLRTLCGEFDAKIDSLHRQVYGRPMLSREEQERRRAGRSFVKPMDDGIDVGLHQRFESKLMGLVSEPDNFEAAWLYIRSFGYRYERILNAFANACAHPLLCRHTVTGPIRRKQLSDLGVVEWAMSRLDALEEMIRDGEPADATYSPREAAETHPLLSLIWNAAFASGDNAAADHFIRAFGQEYLLRERVGALDPGVRQAAAEILGQSEVKGIVGERGEPLLLLRPCAAARAGLAMPGFCRVKESREGDFFSCKCGRAAYCSAMCEASHEQTHAASCAFSQRAQQRGGPPEMRVEEAACKPCQQLRADGLSVANPSLSDSVASASTSASAAVEGEDGGSLACSSCQVSLPKASYTLAQLKKKGKRRCKYCVGERSTGNK
jgi:hypothetical protein